MNIFCRLFGHTWWPETDAPELRWNTTDKGHTLVPSLRGDDVRHFERCKRCGDVRELGSRRHDGDRPETLEEAG